MTRPDNEAPRWQYYAVLLWTLFCACLCIASVAAHMQIGLNNDNLDLLDQVQRWLAGGTPYVAFADVNPPLIHMLYVLPALLTKWGLLPAAASLYIFTFALTALALAVSAAILGYGGAGWAQRRILLGTLALALVFTPFIHQAFADRDHLMLVLAAPWLILYSPPVRREAVPLLLRLAAAAMAAVGLAIKPYAYVFYLAAVIFAAVSGRSLRRLVREPEHYVIGGFALAYLAVVFIFFHAYVASVLPLAWQTYGAQCWNMQSKLFIVWHDLLGGFGAVLLAEAVLLLFVRPAAYDKTVAYLFLLLPAGLGSYLLNGGWYYTQYPFIAVAFVLSVALACKLLAAAGGLRGRILFLPLLAPALAAGIYWYYMEPVAWRAYKDITVQRRLGHPWENIDLPPGARQFIDAHLATHPRFMFFTLFERSVVLQKEGTKRRNVGRYDYLWPLPGLVRMQHDPSRQRQFQDLSTRFADGLADDIVHNAPDMIISDVSPYQLWLPHAFDTVGWLKAYPRFAAAWNEYRLAGRVNICAPRLQTMCAFDVYYRNTDKEKP